ncbi:MAG: hypothetical protein AAFV77_03905 [Planctomycetota bacterium]
MAEGRARRCQHCDYDIVGLNSETCPECGGNTSNATPPAHWAAASQRWWLLGLGLLATFWGCLLAGPLVDFYQRGYTNPGDDAFLFTASVGFSIHVLALFFVLRRRRWFKRKDPIESFFEVVSLAMLEIVGLLGISLVS